MTTQHNKKSNQLVEFSQDSASTMVGQGVIFAKMLMGVNKLMCNTHLYAEML